MKSNKDRSSLQKTHLTQLLGTSYTPRIVNNRKICTKDSENLNLLNSNYQHQFTMCENNEPPSQKKQPTTCLLNQAPEMLSTQDQGNPSNTSRTSTN
jgi:hypothetical protein